MTMLSIHAVGEAALCCTLPPPASLERQQRIWQLAAELANMPGVLELIPGMNNLTLVFDPLATEPAALEQAVQLQWAKPPRSRRLGRRVDIPVRYGGEAGPDLADVAAHCGLSPEEVVRRHTAAEYVVYFIGFQPGFAYLGGLDEALHTPRRAEPRVGRAGRQRRHRRRANRHLSSDHTGRLAAHRPHRPAALRPRGRAAHAAGAGRSCALRCGARMIELLRAGPLTTVQDLGRSAWRDRGISHCGALDDIALSWGNLLVGNPVGAAGLEFTLGPATLRFSTDCCIAITGTDAEATLDGRPLRPWWRQRMQAGQTLKLAEHRASECAAT